MPSSSGSEVGAARTAMLADLASATRRGHYAPSSAMSDELASAAAHRQYAGLYPGVDSRATPPPYAVGGAGRGVPGSSP